MSDLKSILFENASNQGAVFVFPTDIACQKWADWVVKNTGVTAVPMERFLAWDAFKGSCIRSDVKELRTVPALMRKIFAMNLIQKNAEKPFFKNLIVPRYAKEASSFADWISSLLPSLKMWKNLREHQKIQIEFSDSEDDVSLKKFYDDYKKIDFTDDEDSDYEILYGEYKKFLDEHKLFDPAWVEPDFSGDENGREYFLVYPETLEDWEQYRHKLSSIEKIHIISVPETEGEYESYFFENSSVEVKDAALFLRDSHDNDGIAWNEMAVNVPNLDNYGSYLDRELSLYEIPHTIRYSRPLSSYGAGIFFSQIQECAENNFSYESVKNLLLNEDLPWVNKPTIESFLQFGRMNNCICTTDEVAASGNGKAIRTVWDEAFSRPIDDKGRDLNKDELLKTLYASLVKYIPPLVNAKTFSEIRTAYEDFRENFFDMAAFQKMELSNNVLSRCITTLNEIVDLEEDFPDCAVASPYSFFVSHLSRVQYLPQGEARAVQVYPYRSAPAAPYEIHVVVDSTQDSLSVGEIFKPLDFMNENKRRLFMKLGQADENLSFSDSDPSFDFIKMYQHSSQKKAYFTASKHAYNGEYGFAYGKMEKTRKKNSGFRLDPYLDEKKLLLKIGGNEAASYSNLKKIYKKQSAGLSAWKERSLSEDGNKKSTLLFEKNADFTSLIQKHLRFLSENKEGKAQKDPRLLKKIEVTQKTLKEYFECPRKWLFKNIFKLAPLNNEAELIDEFIIGRVNHRIFELFLSKIKKEREMLSNSSENPEKLPEKFRKFLFEAMNESVDDEKETSAFKEIFESLKNNTSSQRFEKITASQTTIKVVASQYKIQNFADSEKNANFRMLEKSLAKLCEIYKGFTVYALETAFQALPPEKNGESPKNYYFNGVIDCILASPNEKNFAVVDFKTSGVPQNLFASEKDPEKPIDFQMPLYLYLLENPLDEKMRLDVASATFYSIKKCEKKDFKKSGDSDDAENSNKVSTAREKFLEFAERFYDEVTLEEFAVNAVRQPRSLCASKGHFKNCTDYHALCRRYFTVSGEEND